MTTANGSLFVRTNIEYRDKGSLYIENSQLVPFYIDHFAFSWWNLINSSYPVPLSRSGIIPEHLLSPSWVVYTVQEHFRLGCASAYWREVPVLQNLVY